MVFNIPNSVTDENEFFAKYDKSYLDSYDETFMIMYLYLQRHRSIEGYVNLTIKDFLLYYNMTPERKKGRTNDKVKDTLQLMVDKKFISYIGCFSNGGLASVRDVDCNMMFTVQLINSKTIWNPENKFIKVLYSEIDMLRINKVNPINKVLNVYLNIKKYISGDESSPGAMMACYPSKEFLSKNCGYGVSTIDSYVEILCGIKMLYMKNYGSYKRIKKGQESVLNSNNVYALEEKYLDDNYVKKPFIEYLKNNYGFVDGFYPLCNNLPDANSTVDEDKTEKDYSVEEILDMQTSNDICIEETVSDECSWGENDPMDSLPPVNNDVLDTSDLFETETVESETFITNPIKRVVIKVPSSKEKVLNEVPVEVEMQRYMDKMYESDDMAEELMLGELKNAFPKYSGDYENILSRAKKFHEMNI